MAPALALPQYLQIARELGILTAAAVTKPLLLKVARAQIAEAGIAALMNIDSLITIPTRNCSVGKAPVLKAFNLQRMMCYLVPYRVLLDLIIRPGMISVDLPMCVPLCLKWVWQ